MEDITRHEYWTEVASIAKTVTEEARADADDIIDRLHETIDSHQWVIYTFYNMQVLAIEHY